jgi:hypothetical protein
MQGAEMARRSKRIIENIGWFLTLVIPVTVIVLSKNNAPAPPQNALVLLGFLIAFPLIAIALKREWRQLRGDDPQQ